MLEKLYSPRERKVKKDFFFEFWNYDTIALREQYTTYFECDKVLLCKQIDDMFMLIAHGIYRAGSIIVDFTSVINTETTTDPESKLADALVALATNGITINGTFTNAQIIIGGLTGKSVNNCMN